MCIIRHFNQHKEPMALKRATFCTTHYQSSLITPIVHSLTLTSMLLITSKRRLFCFCIYITLNGTTNDSTKINAKDYLLSLKWYHGRFLFLCWSWPICWKRLKYIIRRRPFSDNSLFETGAHLSLKLSQ